MGEQDQEWAKKMAATLSDKTAAKEFGLTQAIAKGIRTGQLQYRVSSIHGNPWLRLLRREVEEFVEVRHGARYLRDRRARAKLTHLNGDLKRPRSALAAMEERRGELLMSRSTGCAG